MIVRDCLRVVAKKDEAVSPRKKEFSRNCSLQRSLMTIRRIVLSVHRNQIRLTSSESANPSPPSLSLSLVTLHLHPRSRNRRTEEECCFETRTNDHYGRNAPSSEAARGAPRSSPPHPPTSVSSSSRPFSARPRVSCVSMSSASELARPNFACFPLDGRFEWASRRLPTLVFAPAKTAGKRPTKITARARARFKLYAVIHGRFLLPPSLPPFLVPLVGLF